MIPLATVVAVDIGGILGGAVITETVFEWNAMGRMFIDGLRDLDPNPVMAFFVVIAIVRRRRQPDRRPDVRRARPADPDRGAEAPS